MGSKKATTTTNKRRKDTLKKKKASKNLAGKRVAKSKVEPYTILGKPAEPIDNPWLRDKPFKYIPTLVLMNGSNSMCRFADPHKINIIMKGAYLEGGCEGSGLTYIMDSLDYDCNFKDDYYISELDTHITDCLYNMQSCGIHVPEWKPLINNSSGNAYMEIGKQYMLKSFGAARSLGKAVVNRAIYISMEQWIGANFIHDDDLNGRTRAAANLEVGLKFNKRYNLYEGHYVMNSERIRLFQCFIQRNVMIQEYVDIDVEYRLYYIDTPTGGKWNLMYREGTQIKQGVTQDTYEVSMDLLDDEMFSNIKNYISKFNSPCICFDIYKDTQGNWGVFESHCTWSMEPDEIVDMIGDRLTDAYLHHINCANPTVRLIQDALSK